ncbi:unnamed protein product [Paramecium sonneborni]|uniref:Glutathione S-transferase n=1 Tax=Paramecium sonneborni TaxID=65129 RepID=A0A8S1QV62_9CILI|nr:unnamed protein product [Paramecium sonneborni]
MSLKLYIDWLSQPSRFVSIVLNILKVPHEVVEIRIAEGKQRTPEYAKINPYRKVPAIVDKDGFQLAESHAIIKYIIKSRNIKTNLYPEDPQQSGKIDEYLDYHHTGTRKLAQYFFNLMVAPKLGIETTVNLEQAKKEALLALKFLETKFSTQDYICGKEISLADISAYCEIMQLHMVNWDFSKYPNILNWMQRVTQIKEVNEGHEVLQKIVQKIRSKPKL